MLRQSAFGPSPCKMSFALSFISRVELDISRFILYEILLHIFISMLFHYCQSFFNCCYGWCFINPSQAIHIFSLPIDSGSSPQRSSLTLLIKFWRILQIYVIFLSMIKGCLLQWGLQVPAIIWGPFLALILQVFRNWLKSGSGLLIDQKLNNWSGK